MLLSGPIDRIRASPASNDGIAGIRFYRNGKAKTFGTIFDRTDESVIDNYVEWAFFPNEKPLIGYYGSQNG